VRNALAVTVPLILCPGCARQAASVEDLVPATLISGQASIPYPPELYARRLEGDVMLYLVVDSAGLVVRDSTRIVKSSGQAAFDAAALEAAPGLRFAAAHRGTASVTAPIQIPIRFTLPDSLKNNRDHQ
jgi:TonB family protein